MDCVSPTIIRKMRVPCGKCGLCRKRRAHEWSFRLQCEMLYHKDSSFITLTYDDENIPVFSVGDITFNPLYLAPIQKFMKRLRKEVGTPGLKYYYCGEYGDQTGRPHYHIALLGYFPNDLRLNPTTRKMYSPLLCKLWPYGMNCVGDLTADSCLYVAKYIDKAVIGRNKPFNLPKSVLERFPDHECIALIDFKKYGVMNPFARMSKGIGKRYAVENALKLAEGDPLKFRGFLRGIPRYYLNALGIRSGVLNYEDENLAAYTDKITSNSVRYQNDTNVLSALAFEQKRMSDKEKTLGVMSERSKRML